MSFICSSFIEQFCLLYDVVSTVSLPIFIVSFCGVHNPSTSATLMSGGGEMSDTRVVSRMVSDW